MSQPSPRAATCRPPAGLRAGVLALALTAGLTGCHLAAPTGPAVAAGLIVTGEDLGNDNGYNAVQFAINASAIPSTRVSWAASDGQSETGMLGGPLWLTTFPVECSGGRASLTIRIRGAAPHTITVRCAGHPALPRPDKLDLDQLLRDGMPS